VSTHLVFTCAHAHYQHDNDRASWLGQLITDIKPDVVINLGDNADMPSLSSFDKGTRAAMGKTYEKDINAFLDFQEKLFDPLRKQKKKLPYFVFCEGNHEHRIEKAVNASPELEGAVSLEDLDLEAYYDDVVLYEGNTPGHICIDGCWYSHFFTSGTMGRPVSGEHTAHTLLQKTGATSTQGHTHEFDFCVRSRVDGSKVYGAVVGCYQDYTNDWAGKTAVHWDRGVLVKRNVEKGTYDHEWISLKTLAKEYGTN
jgi:hypothetical protein